MKKEEKTELTVWSAIGLIAVALVIGVVYVNRTPDGLNDISPAAGTSSVEEPGATEDTYGPSQPTQPAQE